MASLQGGGGEREADWDLDTDEIQSLDSDGLHSSRPNRWQGTQSAWLGITEQDRLESTALDLVRNRDLSIHLYNAFALKHRRQRAQSTREQDTKETADQEAEDSGDWAPPALWTAWPLREDRLPLDDFMRGPQDDDDVFTFRRQSDSEPGTTPSSPLEEMVSATVLKLARERFLKRRLAQQQQQPRKHDEMDVASPSRAVSDDDADIMEEDMAEGEEQNAADVTAGNGDGLIPGVSTADEASYEILRPATRHILEKLDRTLTVLHNARVAGISYLTDSSATSGADEENSDSRDSSMGPAGPARGRSTRRGSASRKGKAQAPAAAAAESRESSAQRSTSRRGRPRKHHLPRGGETEQDMLIRVARESHKKIPVFSGDGSNTMAKEEAGSEPTASTAERKTGRKARAAKGRNRQKRQREPRPGESKREMLVRIAREQHRPLPSFNSGDEDDDDDDDSGDGDGGSGSGRRPSRQSSSSSLASRPGRTTGGGRDHRGNLLERWRSRDWSDVLGAAALNGFSPRVIDRAAQRCARLFGQEMSFHTLTEVPARARGGGRTTTRYPAQQQSDDATSDDDDDVTDHASQAPASPASRRASPARSGDDSGGKPKQRPRSATPSQPAQFCCPVVGCARATQGFSRQANMKRHLKLVHSMLPEPEDGGGSDADSKGNIGPSEAEEEDDEDMDGAVHVDGFLQPIVIQRGWRGRGVTPGRSRSRSKSRPRRLDADDERGYGSD